jgi:hypothetical protein
MEKYITKDKIADFVMKLWEEGIRVDLEPDKKQLCIHLKNGRYKWLPVYEKASYDELIESFINPTEED